MLRASVTTKCGVKSEPIAVPNAAASSRTSSSTPAIEYAACCLRMRSSSTYSSVHADTDPFLNPCGVGGGGGRLTTGTHTALDGSYSNSVSPSSRRHRPLCVSKYTRGSSSNAAACSSAGAPGAARGNVVGAVADIKKYFQSGRVEFEGRRVWHRLALRHLPLVTLTECRSLLALALLTVLRYSGTTILILHTAVPNYLHWQLGAVFVPTPVPASNG